ncbi:type II secretion system protein N [Oceanobacter mangrovi]|uniref:type II secretion system protein N n=1 Tax=Oceanobacter mangrovi TaxID=2862510 RepID=UPI001C8EE433|nr:type II secretion system protein N [Oceanobacter mangrovi]
MNAVQLPVWQKLTLLTGKLALTLAISWQASQLIWDVVAPAPLVLQAPAVAAKDSAAPQTAGTSRYHLFGEPSREPPKVVQQAVEAPETKLRLTLLGINQSSRAELSSAIVSVSGRPGEYFRMGDTVQGRTKLAGVQPDRIILDTAGKLETLKFDDAPMKGSEVRNIAPSADRDGDPDADQLPERLTKGSLMDRFKKVRNADEFVDVASAEISEDPVAALNKMGLEPQGSGEGYRVKPGSPLMQFKLRPGDVVLSLNGQSLGDPASDQSLLADLQNAGEVMIEVQRGDSRFTVNHSLE